MTSANTAQKVVLTNSPNTGSFSYEPLESDGDIRLLKLQSSISRGAEVACELIKDNISRSPLYAAVSYTWANSGPLTKISVNGKEFSVRKNVADLLVRLRTTDYTRTLWIDSICIDQASENEKGSQVRLMGDIFAGASYVITWLDQHQWSLSLDALAASGGNYGKLTPETSDWFIDHRYWTRRWIVQEILLARSVVLISAEGRQIPLLQCNDLLQAGLQSHQSHNRHRAQHSAFGRLFAPKLRLSRKHCSDLAEALYTYHETNCSDLTDRVYALVSLSEKARHHLKVDYGIKRHHLLISVLDFCSRHEALPWQCRISLVSLLQHQLSISNDELQKALSVRTHLSGLRIGHEPWTKITMRGRGTVNVSEPLSSKSEEHVLHCRSRVPPLTKLRWDLPPKFSGTPHHYLEMHPQQIDTITPEFAERISGHDLLAFSFTDKEGQFRLGLSSSWLKDGDKLFQCCRTPVALCIRQNLGIVGRAYILKKISADEYDFRSILSVLKLEEILDFDDEDVDLLHQASLAALNVQIDVPVLMDLLKWLNFDQVH